MIWGFIIGLLVGIGICLGQTYRLKSQLAKILTFSPDIADLLPYLSIVSLVNREVSYFKKLRQQQENELRIWQEGLDQAPIGFLWIDGENRLLWCNQAARSLLQIDRWQPSQVRLLLELVRSYELDQVIETTRASQIPQVQEWLYHSSRRSFREDNQEGFGLNQDSIALKSYTYPFSDGQVSVFIENQQPLRDLSRSRDRAFSDLTHELRTPLTAISLLAETLQNRLNPPESRWSEKITQEVARLISLIQEWLDLSQLEEDPSQHLYSETLLIENLIHTAWHTLEPIAEEKGITFYYQEHISREIEGDRNRLIQVFLNLLDNSVKHSPINGEIRVIVSQFEENKLQIDLFDQGSGFTPQDLPHIFERLYRGEASRTRQPNPDQKSLRQGSGLGLAIVKQIIQAHGGTIEAKNHPETGGAWLKVILPLN